MKKIKIWIARDEGIYDDDHKLIKRGKLHIFYDTPLVDSESITNSLKFVNSRCIGEIPNYMYPFIKEGDCYELSSDNSSLRFSEFKEILNRND